MELGLPVIVALNMLDTAEAHGRSVNAKILEAKLGAPVVPLIAHKGQGLDDLREQLAHTPPLPKHRVPPPPALNEATDALKQKLQAGQNLDDVWAHALALRMLVSDSATDAVQNRWGKDWQPTVNTLRKQLRTADVDTIHAEATERYRWINEVCHDALTMPKEERRTLTQRLDNALTHRVWGPLIFLALMLLVFQSIYSWASYPMDAIDAVIQWLGGLVTNIMPAGALRSLLVDGVLAGVGAVVVFLPQILFLFFFLALLDDSGYLARAAFIMDKLMSSVGLHGRSFIPLMSSFACAIPGIMATRTIENKRDRFLTILIAPLMSCSARLPVYTLMIGAFIPNRRALGVISLPALTMLAMYLVGIGAAMVVGWVFRRTLFKGQPSPFLLELPPYRLPVLRNVVITMWERGSEFLKRAGTIILAISIVLWFLVAYPQRQPLPNETEAQAAGEQIRHSYAGRIGHLIEPVVQPLGFDWKMGIGLIASFAAREVLVSTLATVYNVGEADESSVTLREALRREKYPDGRPVYTPLVAVSLMVFFVLACQCMSTIAVVRRETNSWAWATFMFGYMTALAYIGSLVVYQVGFWVLGSGF
jgi:ferrous iron transport protein B